MSSTIDPFSYDLEQLHLPAIGRDEEITAVLYFELEIEEIDPEDHGDEGLTVGFTTQLAHKLSDVPELLRT